MSNPARTPPPVVCTLTTKDRASQALEWSDLAELALTRHELGDGMQSTYPLAMADAVEDLAQRELSCCGSWLTIEVERQPEAVRLTLTTPNPDGLALIRSIAGLDDGS